MKQVGPLHRLRTHCSFVAAAGVRSEPISLDAQLLKQIGLKLPTWLTAPTVMAKPLLQ
jgi:hypothetical protein